MKKEDILYYLTIISEEVENLPCSTQFHTALMVAKDAVEEMTEEFCEEHS